MSSQLQLFSFEGKEVRTLKINDEPYFVGKDVATILGYDKKPVEEVEVNRAIDWKSKKNQFKKGRKNYV